MPNVSAVFSGLAFAAKCVGFRSENVYEPSTYAEECHFVCERERERKRNKLLDGWIECIWQHVRALAI